MLEVNNLEKKGLTPGLGGFSPCLLVWPDHYQLSARQTITTGVATGL